ncbi:hypothetical protein, partial [Thermococcus sp. GR7]
DIYLLYDLVEYHLPQKFVEYFKLLVLAATEGKNSDFEEHLDNMKGILDAFRTLIIFPDECPYIMGAIDKENVPKLIEEVQELKKKKIKIEIDKKEQQEFYF